MAMINTATGGLHAIDRRGDQWFKEVYNVGKVLEIKDRDTGDPRVKFSSGLEFKFDVNTKKEDLLEIDWDDITLLVRWMLDNGIEEIGLDSDKWRAEKIKRKIGEGKKFEGEVTFDTSMDKAQEVHRPVEDFFEKGENIGFRLDW